MSSDPFSGLKLSQATAPPKLDQRLFTSEPVRPSPKIPSLTQTSAEPMRSDPVPKQERKGGLKLESLTRQFSLDDQPLYKYSYLFTPEEQEALQDLQIELSRDLEIKVTKNDVIRMALHMLVEDYSKNVSQSYVRRKIIAKSG